MGRGRIDSEILKSTFIPGIDGFGSVCLRAPNDANRASQEADCIGLCSRIVLFSRSTKLELVQSSKHGT